MPLGSACDRTVVGSRGCNEVDVRAESLAGHVARAGAMAWRAGGEYLDGIRVSPIC